VADTRRATPDNNASYLFRVSVTGHRPAGTGDRFRQLSL